MSPSLSVKQQRVLDFIQAHVRRSGYPPTVREICDALKLAGPNSAKKFLDILERKGCIRRRPGCSRAIELLSGQAAASAVMVPVVGAIRAGLPDLAIEEVEQTVAVDPAMARGKELLFLRVTGDSMTGAHILDGDLALICRQPQVTQGDIAAVLIGDEATLKFFYKEKGVIRLEAANPAYGPIVIAEKDTAQVRIIGRVEAVLRLMGQKASVAHGAY